MFEPPVTHSFCIWIAIGLDYINITNIKYNAEGQKRINPTPLNSKDQSERLQGRINPASVIMCEKMYVLACGFKIVPNKPHLFRASKPLKDLLSMVAHVSGTLGHFVSAWVA